ncbi:MAG: methyltransferase domain-containing protein [Magnetospirillum sp.]|nr:methyltransferase domain-containing protein [Magnetospirillum sp.]
MNGTADTPNVDLGSPERFGFSWERFSSPTADQREQFARWTCLLKKDDWAGLSFLDVGCGVGRNSLWASEWGAGPGLAIDLDPRSLALAHANLAGRNVEVQRRSAYEIGETDRFDIVFSIGVIHHLDRPEVALAQMVAAAKPGGRVLIWVYGYENMEAFVHVLNPLRRLLFSRLPLRWVWGLSLLPAGLLWLALRGGLSRIEYFRLLRQFRFGHLRHIVFDQMIPKISNYWRQSEVRTLMARAGLDAIELAWVNEMSWCAMGRKPGTLGK